MLKYKILNWLFGWDYILTDTVSIGYEAKRLHKINDYYFVKSNNNFFEIHETDKIKFITCERKKYFPNKN